MLPGLKHSLIFLLKTDLRRKNELLTLAMYGISLLFMIGYAARTVTDQKNIMLLFWMLQVFSVLFVERKAFLDLATGQNAVGFMYWHPLECFLSRWIYFFLINFLLGLIYALFFEMWFRQGLWFSGSGICFLLSGLCALHTVGFAASSFGMAHEKGNAVSVLAAIPLIVPALMIILKIGFYFADGLQGVFGGQYLTMLWAVNGITFVLSVLIFPYLWKP
ncbi:MAG: hypothetical protein N3F09_00965 [Bacteroidia bacterium]|nr:hypothetical protein [Bacteroidia bacterium]